MIKIYDYSDKGNKNRKGLRYEVSVCHGLDHGEPTRDEIVAKFASYGDAYMFAIHISKGNIYYEGIIINS